MNHRTTSRDHGSILPIVLVLSVSLALVVAALATYITTGLRYGQVVEARADRLAAADGALRYAVERLRLGSERLCITTGGDTIDVPIDINGAVVTVNCAPAGDGFNDGVGWALVLTGEELPLGGALLRTQSGLGGPVKEINGAVYMSTLDFDTTADLRFVRGVLMRSDCSNFTLPGNVTGGDGWLGLQCLSTDWDAEFIEPVVPVTLPAASDPVPNPPPYDINGCSVFVPGYYDASPSLTASNYFMSGNYVFDGFTMNVANAVVTAGRAPGVAATGATQFIPNPTCDDARNSDTNSGILDAGATFYLQNGARFEIGGNGSLEVLRRLHGKQYVSIHVLDNSLTWDDDVILQKPGTNKDMAMHGMVWAPEARITFAEVTNQAKGQLLGGGALSNIDLRTSAVGGGFVISIEPSDLHGTVQFDSVATIDGGTTTIRSIVDYRPSTDYTAIKSWRVVD